MPDASRSGFQTTSWTLVRAAAGSSSAGSSEALSKLCQGYWHPVYAFIRRLGYDREQSQDLTQGFFTRLIERNYLMTTDRERGRFRSFLLTSVKHFLANEWDRENAMKRGGRQAHVAMDLAEAEGWITSATVERSTPESLFERRWALSVLENVMVKMRAEFAQAGKSREFDRMSIFLNKDSDALRYEALAKELAVSAGALRTFVHRLRRKYRHMLRTEVAQTVSSPEEVDDEPRLIGKRCAKFWKV
jgi:RNA polymerase sigma-70 factor (ECF subfamily)